MSKRVTLKDLATDLNISRTTVHRALHGKEGISSELRTTIQTRANELGYTTNYVASSLKRKTIRLAVVLPEASGNGQYYHKYFWDSIREFQSEANNLNTQIEPYSFDEDKDDQLQILEKIFNNGRTDIDGLLTMPARCDEDMRRAINCFSFKNIPVILIDNDLPESGRLCCVAPHNELTGRLGAEILTAITHTPGKILVASGSPQNASHRHNLQGFKEYLSESEKKFQVVEVYNYGNYQKCYEEASALLLSQSDIVAFYSVTARDTIPLTQAVIDNGYLGRLWGVGSDLYPQSAAFLEQNAIQALIYKNAYDKGYLGFKILFDYVVKNLSPESDQVAVPISIIMKNNLRFFENRI